jgi:hypothetical protein
MTREIIVEKVRHRIEQYQKDGDDFFRFQSWFQKVLDPLINRIELRCWPWEAAVDAIVASKPAEGDTIKEFYSRCLKYNQEP